jgi:hypothetical protein
VFSHQAQNQTDTEQAEYGKAVQPPNTLVEHHGSLVAGKTPFDC